MKRYRDLEKLQANVRAEIPKVAVSWLAVVRKEMEKLTKAALSGEVSDEEFRRMVEKTSKRLPELLGEMDHDALADLMEKAQGASMANGIAARVEDFRKATTKRAKLPWEKDVRMGAGKGKRCGNSWISANKECRLNLGSAWDGDDKQMKERAKEAMRSLPKKLSHPDTGFEMEMNTEAIRKTLNQCKSAEEFTAAGRMGEIFLSSRKHPPMPDRKNHHDVKAFHEFTALVRIGGRDREAVITVTEYKPNNDPGKQTPHFKLFRLRSIKKGT